MLAILKREIKSYFLSPIAYVLIGVFVVINSIFFRSNLQDQTGFFNSNLSFMCLILVFIIPVLTMKVLAEDRKNGTDVLLITSPVSLTRIVIGKYLATFFVYLVMICITVIYPLILMMFGKLSLPQLIGGYVGVILLGAAYIAVGIFTSSLSENQVVSAVVGIASLFIMYIISNIADTFGGLLAKVLNWISLLSRYDDFDKGVLSLSPIVYYLSFTIVFVFLTIRVIEKRRWSQG